MQTEARCAVLKTDRAPHAARKRQTEIIDRETGRKTQGKMTVGMRFWQQQCGAA
jgi:hypothetical protein